MDRIRGRLGGPLAAGEDGKRSGRETQGGAARAVVLAYRVYTCDFTRTRPRFDLGARDNEHAPGKDY